VLLIGVLSEPVHRVGQQGGQHRSQFPGYSIEEYDASAQRTLDDGTYFEYFHIASGETRIGCYDLGTGRFTILDTDDLIVSHFICDEAYIERLPYNTYDPGEE
jgi:hypothetical protein